MENELIARTAYLLAQRETCTPEYLSKKMNLNLEDAKTLYKNVLKMISSPTVSEKTARAKANQYLLKEVGDAFGTKESEFMRIRDRPIWLIPIQLSYPKLGHLGKVGEILIDGISGKIVGMTPVNEIEEKAEKIYRKHKDEIESPLS